MDQLLDHEEMSKELVRGRELVSQLRVALGESVLGGRRDGPVVDGLMEDISGSFTRAIHALSCRDQQGVRQLDLENTRRRSSPNLDAREEERLGNAAEISDLRGRCAGRRRREYSNAQKFISTKPLEDGHFWKKYGQKKILGAKYPRSYFKCSQNKDQGCQAIKQVQRIQDEPPMFLVTYIGQHTCINAMHSSQLVADASSQPDECLLSFETDQTSISQTHPWSSSKRALPTHLRWGETSTSTNYQVPRLETSYDIPMNLTEDASHECSPFSWNEPGYGDATPGMDFTIDMDSMGGLLQSVIGYCSDGGVDYKRNVK